MRASWCAACTPRPTPPSSRGRYGAGVAVALGDGEEASVPRACAPQLAAIHARAAVVAAACVASPLPLPLPVPLRQLALQSYTVIV